MIVFFFRFFVNTPVGVREGRCDLLQLSTPPSSHYYGQGKGDPEKEDGALSETPLTDLQVWG